jgi:hypothetical protein
MIGRGDVLQQYVLLESRTLRTRLCRLEKEKKTLKLNNFDKYATVRNKTFFVLLDIFTTFFYSLHHVKHKRKWAPINITHTVYIKEGHCKKIFFKALFHVQYQFTLASHNEEFSFYFSQKTQRYCNLSIPLKNCLLADTRYLS